MIFRLNFQFDKTDENGNIIEKQIKIHAGDDLVKVATDFVKENGLEREAAHNVYQLVK